MLPSKLPAAQAQSIRAGQVSEWLKEPVSKTGIPATVSWVRIPPCPSFRENPAHSPSSGSGRVPVLGGGGHRTVSSNDHGGAPAAGEPEPPPGPFQRSRYPRRTG